MPDEPNPEYIPTYTYHRDIERLVDERWGPTSEARMRSPIGTADCYREGLIEAYKLLKLVHDKHVDVELGIQFERDLRRFLGEVDEDERT